MRHPVKSVEQGCGIGFCLSPDGLMEQPYQNRFESPVVRVVDGPFIEAAKQARLVERIQAQMLGKTKAAA